MGWEIPIKYKDQKYVITTDSKQFIVNIERVNKKTEKIELKAVAYYGDPESFMLGLANRILRKCDIDSFEQILNEIIDLKNAIKNNFSLCEKPKLKSRKY